MKKILLFAALVCAVSGRLFAQTTSTGSSSSAGGGKFSVGVDAGLPVGTANTYYSTAIGGDLKYAHQVAPNVALSISAGYTELIGKTFSVSYNDGTSYGSFGGTTANVGAIPVKAGARFSSGGASGFFGEAQVGAAFFTEQGAGVAFAYAPAIGYYAGGFEVGVRYEGWAKSGTIGQVALRIAISF